MRWLDWSLLIYIFNFYKNIAIPQWQNKHKCDLCFTFYDAVDLDSSSMSLTFEKFLLTWKAGWNKLSHPLGMVPCICRLGLLLITIRTTTSEACFYLHVNHSLRRREDLYVTEFKKNSVKFLFVWNCSQATSHIWKVQEGIKKDFEKLRFSSLERTFAPSLRAGLLFAFIQV